LIIGTAGHIDHGKTQLVKALTGVDTDRLPEEKRRGITIDLGFAPLLLDGVGTVGVIDVPGHEDFVRSMVVGASGIDLALLVVAADEGVMPQTREHLSILNLLRIPRLVVALTKCDLVDDEWLTLVRADVAAVVGSGGQNDPPIVSCSSRTGAGLEELRAVLSAKLNDGTARKDEDLFRLPVDRAFSVKGTGTVVTGTVWSGELAVDDVVRILPAERATRVRRIEQHGRPVGCVRAGNRAAIALSGTELSDVARGAVLVRDHHWQPTSVFEAVVAFDAESVQGITSRSWLRLHAGASEVGARVAMS
jgi:selenocysteine-specific elongation factor